MSWSAHAFATAACGVVPPDAVAHPPFSINPSLTLLSGKWWRYNKRITVWCMGSASASGESDTSSGIPRIQCSQSHGSFDACGVCPGLPLLADAACLRLCDVPLDIFVQQESLPLER